jgi:succinoglycan biosynthesis protein ExoA
MTCAVGAERAHPPDGCPTVSVVIPAFNEETHIRECVASALRQTYPWVIEVIIADGASTDRTRDIVEAMAQLDPRVRLIDNPRRTQARGLNLAIAAASGEVIARLDGHAFWPAEHIERCVRLLEQTGADNVGGTMDAVGETPVGEAIARASRSPFAVGGARYRYARAQVDTDTVWLGCFRRSALDRVGPFDERFPPHEDYELNYRIRSSGGRIVFSPDLPTRYVTRSSWRALATQYFRYGRGKVRVARHSLGVIRPYHLAPPIFVAALATTPILAAMVPYGRYAALAAAGAYVVACLGATIPAGSGTTHRTQVRIPVVFPILHASWGLGFWAGVAEGVRESTVRGVARLR